MLSKIGVFIAGLRYKIKLKLGLIRTPKILPYRGFGNTRTLVLRGRVLEDKRIAKPLQTNSIWHNILAMYKRYTSEDIPYATIQATFQNQTKEICANRQGYFLVTFHPDAPLANGQDWYDIHLRLKNKITKQQGEVVAVGQVLVNKNNAFGIISDVDDTILISSATNLRQKLRLMLLKNAHTRMPFKGVAAFYNALQEGKEGNCHNPIFYVSSSSWNLYDLLIDFCEVKGIPKGPFLLRDSRLDEFKFISSIHKKHKLEKIENIMDLNKNLPFILIGDSGQRDPEIYKEVALSYPGKILAIYIRDIGNESREAELAALGLSVKELGIDFLLVKDTEEAALHAIEQGYISPFALPDIIGEKENDKKEGSGIEQILDAQ